MPHSRPTGSPDQKELHIRLLIARHGETTYNLEQRFLGQADVPLDQAGVLQAQALGSRLATEKIAAVVSSDLARAYDTALAIAQSHSLTVLQDPDLREIKMGAWEGKRYFEAEEQDPDLFARWRADPTLYLPPGGETLEEVRSRVWCALARWLERFPNAPGPQAEEPCVAWVTHAALIGVLLCSLLGMPLSRRWQFQSDNASLSEVRLQDLDRAVIGCFNDTAHLRARGLWRPAAADLYAQQQKERKRGDLKPT
jgi:broad specificity phosphatase PhoE